MIRWTACFVFLLAVSAQTGAAEPVAIQDVFVSGKGGYACYRIPSIIQTKSGALLAFCEARKNSCSDTGNIDLVMRRSEDGGKSWSPLVTVWEDGANVCGNPCPVVDQSTGTIHLWLTWNHGKDHEGHIKARTSKYGGRKPYYSTSADDGKTWTKPKDMSATVDKPEWGWYATGPGVGIQLSRGAHKGRLLIPANHSHEDKMYDAHSLYSDDGGKTWKMGSSVANGANESQVVERDDGVVVFNTRMQTHKKGKRGIAFSKDGGATWETFEHDANLNGPTCQASIVRFAHKGGAFIFSNPATGGRNGMTVRASLDGGKTWPHRKLIHKGSSAYSSLVILGKDHVGLLFERDRYQKVSFVALKFSDGFKE